MTSSTLPVFRFRTPWLAGLVVSLALGACGFPRAGAAPGPLSAADAQQAATRWPGVTPEALEHGRQVFLAHCNACHHYPDRTAIAEDRWPAIVERMGGKAHLDASDREQVLHFILASRAAAPSSGSP